MPADPARKAALDVLTAALTRKAGLETALEGNLLNGLTPQDRGFARALVMATLRQLGPIDRMLDPCLQREPPEAVRMILRLGAAQLFHLDTPAYAAVDSSVALTQTQPGTRGFKALVNAVLRRLGREGHGRPASTAPRLAVRRWRRSARMLRRRPRPDPEAGHRSHARDP